MSAKKNAVQETTELEIGLLESLDPETFERTFDHTSCPRCGATMRLAATSPHAFGDYERRSYDCRSCGNESRFVFERPGRSAPPAMPAHGGREPAFA